MAEVLLALEGVTAGYLGDIDVLRNVSLTVRAGRISGLIGLNGAGKSTLMKTLCGFLRPKTGRVTLERFPVLKEKLAAQAGDLSGGQQKSLEFAKAYMVQPKVCLIDEPSIGLAPRVAAEVFQWIDAFAKSGMGILLVDHNVRRVVAMSDHIYVMSLGEITAEGSPEDFAGDLHAQVREWLGINF